MLPVLKNLLYVTVQWWGRKGYQRSCILLTVTPQHSRDRSRRESNNGIHARWLGEVDDEKSRSWVTRKVVHALWLGQASWVTRKVVCMHVVAVLRIVHELWVVSHESFTCFTTSAFTLYTNLHRTLYRRTHSLPFFCASNVYTTSDVPALAPCVKKCVKKFAKNLAKNLQVHKNSKGKIFLANMLEMVC